MALSRGVSYCALLLLLAFAGCNSSGQPIPEAVDVEVQKVQMWIADRSLHIVVQ